MDHSTTHAHYEKYDRRFGFAVALNFCFVIVESVAGLAVGSLALLADAGHNLSDVLSLFLSWGASLLARKSGTESRTYGYRKVTVLAALASACLLLIALGAITWEAVGRFFSSKLPKGSAIMAVAGVGVLINALTTLLFIKDRKFDLNIRAAFLHMAADALVSCGVVVGGLLISITRWVWIDPLLTLAIVAVVFVGTWGLLKDSLNYAIDAVPKSIDLAGVREYLLGLQGVKDLHDLHIWPLSTTEVALTAHLVVEHTSLDNSFLESIQRELWDRFAIAHATVQVESQKMENRCMLEKPSC